MRRYRILFIIVIFAVVGITAWTVTTRIRWDRNNRSYAIGVGYPNLRNVCDYTGLTLDSVVSRLQDEGVSYLIFRPTSSRFFTEQGSIPSAVSELRARGLRLALSVEEFSESNMFSVQVETATTTIDAINPTILIFESESIFHGWSSSFYSWITTQNYLIGVTEFRPSPLIRKLSHRQYGDIIRVHRVFEESSTLGLQYLENRYIRAVQNRNAGLVQFALQRDSTLKQNISSLRKVNHELQSRGYSLVRNDSSAKIKGAASYYGFSRWFIVPFILACWGGLFLVGSKLIDGRYRRALANGSVAGAGLTLLMLVFFPILTRQFMAFYVALLTPILSYYVIRQVEQICTNKCSGILQGILQLSSAGFMATLGGLVVSTILSQQAFLLHLSQFRGVKAALIVPLVIVTWIEVRDRDYNFEQSALSSPWSVLTGLVVVGFTALILLRSGNADLIAVPELETFIRNWLGSHLYVRPRFKEFLVGHPSLVVYGFLRSNNVDKLYTLALLPLGFLGQVSIVNTFAHLHTPLIVSLIRTGYGLALGIILGGFMLMGVRAYKLVINYGRQD